MGNPAKSSSFLGECRTMCFAVGVGVGCLAESNCTVARTTAQASEIGYGSVIHLIDIQDSCTNQIP
jgi:hypothetical protein